MIASIINEYKQLVDLYNKSIYEGSFIIWYKFYTKDCKSGDHSWYFDMETMVEEDLFINYQKSICKICGICIGDLYKESTSWWRL